MSPSFPNSIVVCSSSSCSSRTSFSISVISMKSMMNIPFCLLCNSSYCCTNFGGVMFLLRVFLINPLNILSIHIAMVTILWGTGISPVRLLSLPTKTAGMIFSMKTLVDHLTGESLSFTLLRPR